MIVKPAKVFEEKVTCVGRTAFKKVLMLKQIFSKPVLVLQIFNQQFMCNNDSEHLFWRQKHGVYTKRG